MKIFLISLLLIGFVSSPLFPGVGAGETWNGNPENFTGLFVLQGNTNLRVSIETGWERDGRIPVVVAFGGLNVYLRVNAGDLDQNTGIETRVSELLVDDMNLDFITYEQNPLRTRMKLSDNSRPIQLKIDRNRRVEVFIGGSRLKLTPIHIAFAEIEPGELYRLTFAGPDVIPIKRFIFWPSRGIIQAPPRRGARFMIDAYPGNNAVWPVWAVKIEQEEERVLNRGEIK